MTNLAKPLSGGDTCALSPCGGEGLEDALREQTTRSYMEAAGVDFSGVIEPA